MKQTPKTTLVRGKKNAVYSKEQIYQIVDSSFLCHVGFVAEAEARVIPTAYVRIGDAIYFHGHLHNQMMNTMLNGQIICITVTLLDGIVLARSGFHHSVNYRSAILFGKAEKVTGTEKVESLNLLLDHLISGRSKGVRPHTQQELNATLVVKVPINEASAKVRTGPPNDAEADYELDIWAGTINLETKITGVDNCPRLAHGVATPEHITNFVKRSKIF